MSEPAYTDGEPAYDDLAPRPGRLPGVYGLSEHFAEAQTREATFKIPRRCPHRGADLTTHGRLDPESCLLTCEHAGYEWSIPSGASVGRRRSADLSVHSTCGDL